MKNFTLDGRLFFAFTCALKVSCALLSWKLHELLFLGVIIPLSLMCIYMYVGYKYKEPSLSLPKFADSIYYLGFLFTICSIIVSLFDIANIGDDLASIATRFGAAMASTAFGVFARVFFVNFRPTLEDAMRNVEDQVVDASNKLADEFQKSFSQLQHFRGEVVTASIETVTNVKTQLNALLEQNAQKLDEYFETVTQQNAEAMQALSKQNAEAFLSIIHDVKTASIGLSTAVDGYTSQAMKSMERMEDSVVSFGDKAMARLESVTFPDDLFTSKLSPSVNQLSGQTDEVSTGIRTLASEVQTAARQVSSSITRLNTKTESFNSMLDVVKEVVGQQQELLDSIDEQNEAVIKMITTQQEAMAQSVAAQQEAIVERFQVQQESMSNLVSSFTNVHQVFERINFSIEASAHQGDTIKALVNQTQDNHKEFVETLRDSLSPLAESINSTALENAELRKRLEETQDANLGYSKQMEDLLNRLGPIDARQSHLDFTPMVSPIQQAAIDTEKPFGPLAHEQERRVGS